MKNIQLIALAIFTMFFSFTLQANNAPNAAKAAAAYKALKVEVIDLMQNPNLRQNGIEHGMVMINFQVNAQNEVEIQHIKSDDAYLQKFVTKRLEDETFSIDGIRQGVTYKLKIEFILE